VLCSALLCCRSDKSEFPNFSRVVSPDDERGQVGALVATMDLFRWNRVTIINTETTYAKDLATSFRGAWHGEVAYTATIETLPGGGIDEHSLVKILKAAPHNDTANNSRVVLLLAHKEHAFSILGLAKDFFPRDTFWVGSESWIGHKPDDLYDDWYPGSPGYLGVAPFRQSPGNSEIYSRFLDLGDSRLRPILSNGLRWDSPWTLPDYAAEYMVDAIVAMVTALAATPIEFRNDGDAVTKKLRELDFEGLSGGVSFTSEGDREGPVFSIMNLQLVNGPGGESYEWIEVGTTKTHEGSARFGDEGIRGVCFAGVGCGLDAAPDDSPPIPRDKVAIWAPVVIAVLCLVFGTVFWWYRSKTIRASRKAKAILAAKESELNDFKNSVVDMCASEEQYVPKPYASSLALWHTENTGIGSVAPLPPPLATQPRIRWCWKENDGFMHKWSDDEIEGNRADRWIKYDVHLSARIEDICNQQDASGTCKLSPDYTINFTTGRQTNNKTNFQREVKRVVGDLQPDRAGARATAPGACDFPVTGRFGGSPPPAIAKEPQMVLVPGDIVQISKKRTDGWAYGSKLHLEDEPLGRRLVQLALSTLDNQSTGGFAHPDRGGVEEDNKTIIITNNHGWFPMAVTRAPDTNDLATLRKTLGGAGDLSPPETWDKIVDPSVVQKSLLRPSSKEYRDVSNSFLMTLPKSTKIVSIHRIQNMALYQSYVVKRKTVVDRDKTLAGNSRSLARFERRWLWHGTNADSIEKIVQQGFNRSFCGKNATFYGKGVYFARDASYSAGDTYSPRDARGNKYVLACRVVVGEFCRGKADARTPDLRDATKNILYDSTVDNPGKPSLYVTYHDAQCYPDYTIVFKT